MQILSLIHPRGKLLKGLPPVPAPKVLTSGLSSFLAFPEPSSPVSASIPWAATRHMKKFLFCLKQPHFVPYNWSVLKDTFQSSEFRLQSEDYELRPLMCTSRFSYTWKADILTKRMQQGAQSVTRTAVGAPERWAGASKTRSGGPGLRNPGSRGGREEAEFSQPGDRQAREWQRSGRDSR